MSAALSLLCFSLDDRRYAIALTAVERVIRAVAITPLPKAPEVVMGVINVHGRIVPAINLRKRFQLPERSLALSDHMVIAHTSKRSLVLTADAVEGVVECAAEARTAAGEVVPGLEYVDGIVRTDDGLILIHHLDRFLALDESALLDEALSNA